MKKRIIGVPNVECSTNGNIICIMNTVTDVSDFGDEIEISNYTEYKDLKRGSVLDLKFIYQERDVDDSKSVTGIFEEDRKDYVLWKITRDSAIRDVTVSTYHFKR